MNCYTVSVKSRMDDETCHVWTIYADDIVEACDKAEERHQNSFGFRPYSVLPTLDD